MSLDTEKPYRVSPDSIYIPSILSLVQRSFAYMEARIDPPSSMHRLTEEAVAQQCEDGEVWAIGEPPFACVFLKYQPDSLYVGKLAVAQAVRGSGYARQLLDIAATRAADKKLSALELQVRVELVENQEVFKRFGFVKTGEDAHEGYDRPTSITMRKAL